MSILTNEQLVLRDYAPEDVNACAELLEVLESHPVHGPRRTISCLRQQQQGGNAGHSPSSA